MTIKELLEFIEKVKNSGYGISLTEKTVVKIMDKEGEIYDWANFFVEYNCEEDV